MTFEEKMKKMLIENGMFENQAADVLELVKQDKGNKAMEERWTDDIERYPTSMVAIAWRSTKTTALEYIKKNIPQAWYKPMSM